MLCCGSDTMLNQHNSARGTSGLLQQQFGPPAASYYQEAADIAASVLSSGCKRLCAILQPRHGDEGGPGCYCLLPLPAEAATGAFRRAECRVRASHLKGTREDLDAIATPAGAATGAFFSRSECRGRAPHLMGTREDLGAIACHPRSYRSLLQ